MLYNIQFSPTGGTQKAAQILLACLSGEHLLADLCDPAFPGVSLNGKDVALIAVPSYAGRVPCTVTERMKKIQGNGARAILLCVYGNRAYDNTLAEMKDQAERAGFRPVAAVAALAEHSMARKVAKGRPDGDDREALRKMAEKIKAKLESGDDSLVEVPGRVPDQPIGNFGGKMAPVAADSCSGCGACASNCPVCAIDAQTLAADQSKCIGCMRCVKVCPGGARRTSMVIKSLGGVALGVLCSQRKENELFL